MLDSARHGYRRNAAQYGGFSRNEGGTAPTATPVATALTATPVATGVQSL